MHSKNLRVKQFVVHARFEVTAAVATKTAVFLDVMFSSLAETCRRFGENCCFLLQSRKAFFNAEDGDIMRIQKSVNFYQTSCRQVPYEGSLYIIGSFRQVPGPSPYHIPWRFSHTFFLKGSRNIYYRFDYTQLLQFYLYMYLLHFSISVRFTLKGNVYKHTYEPKIKFVKKMKCQISVPNLIEIDRLD